MERFQFDDVTSFYQGKVRDVYSIGKNYVVMVASDRLSAFDVILPRPIPYKGQVLTQLASYMMQACSDVCPNWLLSLPAPNVSLGLQCEPIKLEMVVRGNLTGHAWRTYKSGHRVLCGNVLPEEMKENDFFETPIITPSTKASSGHDEDISETEIINQQLTTPGDWEALKNYSLALFARGKSLAAERGLILADTKYEFGKRGNEIILIDEIHTPDSSRYFMAEGFGERLSRGEKQEQLSKEFVREWLMQHDFMGLEGQEVPTFSDEKIAEISTRYISLYEKLTGQNFIGEVLSPGEILNSVNISVQTLINAANNN
ncbi:MAG: phosphoribosylaminoimidazolesuccinocarboxamide synthase [Ferruginibacter sp.]